MDLLEDLKKIPQTMQKKTDDELHEEFHAFLHTLEDIAAQGEFVTQLPFLDTILANAAYSELMAKEIYIAECAAKEMEKRGIECGSIKPFRKHVEELDKREKENRKEVLEEISIEESIINASIFRKGNGEVH